MNIVPNAINHIGQIGSAIMRRGPANAAPARSGNLTPRNGINRSVEHAERLLDNTPDLD